MDPPASGAGTSVATPTGAETYVTAPSTLPEAGRSSGYLSSRLDARPESAHSTTPLMEDPPRITVNDIPWRGDSYMSTIPSNRVIRSGIAVQSTLSNGSGVRGKGKTVHYADEQPAPPIEVLTRTGDQVEDTSAGAALQATVENQIEWGDVIMRGMFYLCHGSEMV